ncbi:MAG TPA: glycosyltransferase [Gaiellaceae bacterium]
MEPRTASGELRILTTCFDFRPGLGGIATVGHKLAEALDCREGVAVRVLAPARDGAKSFDDATGLDIRRVATGTTPLSSVIAYLRAIRREIGTWRPDVVLNLLWLPDGAATCLATIGTRTPYFVFAHGVEVLESKRTFRKRVRGALAPVKRHVFRSAKSALAVSSFTAAKLEDCGIPREQISLVFGGVDPEEFAPAPKPEYLLARHGLHGCRVFVTVSRLHPYKGVDVAIAAFAEIARDEQDVAYVVCGDGPDRPRLEELARVHGIERRVHFTGPVPQSELPAHYNLADAFVLLPREELWMPEAEGFGLVFLEAAACGKAAVAGRSGGVPDAVGATGWLVDPNDVVEVAGAMRAALAEDEASRTARARIVRERAVASFSWDAMADRVLVAADAYRRRVAPALREETAAGATRETDVGG